MRPGQGYPRLSLWGLSDALYDMRVNCLPHTVHLKICLGPRFRVLLTQRRRVVLAVRGREIPKLDVHRLVGGAEIGPDGVSSTTYLGVKGSLVTSAP